MNSNHVPDEGIWKCSRCNQGVTDCYGRRREKKGDGFVLGEMFFCERCADIIYVKQRKLVKK